jgi:hypothetical protein
MCRFIAWVSMLMPFAFISEMKFCEIKISLRSLNKDLKKAMCAFFNHSKRVIGTREEGKLNEKHF